MQNCSRQRDGPRIITNRRAVQGPGKLKPKEELAPHSGRVVAGSPGNARFDSLKVMASGNIAVATLNTVHVRICEG
jgi:hypothetical protein